MWSFVSPDKRFSVRAMRLGRSLRTSPIELTITSTDSADVVVRTFPTERAAKSYWRSYYLLPA